MQPDYLVHTPRLHNQNQVKWGHIITIETNQAKSIKPNYLVNTPRLHNQDQCSILQVELGAYHNNQDKYQSTSLLKDESLPASCRFSNPLQLPLPSSLRNPGPPSESMRCKKVKQLDKPTWSFENAANLRQFLASTKSLSLTKLSDGSWSI